MWKMNDFDKKVAEITGGSLKSVGISLIQVNLGLICTLECSHCHLVCSPARKEIMEWSMMEKVIEIARSLSRCQLVDLTGGSPELVPHFRGLVSRLRSESLNVQVRTNLVVHLEPGMESMAAFLAENKVALVASLPCYLEKNVDAQRGTGVYKRSIEVIRRLNALGYGCNPDLPLNLVYNPAGVSLPPDQQTLEADYKRELGNRFGISFSSLITMTNMPIGSFHQQLSRQRKKREYFDLLKKSFNPQTIEALMCRHQICVRWDGTLFDCDFNLALGLPVDHGAPDHISRFESSAIRCRMIVTGEHCFGCTAGYGSSCSGALV